MKRSAAVSYGNEISGYTPHKLIQYAPDNIDQNITTVDGENIFRGMVLIATELLEEL